MKKFLSGGGGDFDNNEKRERHWQQLELDNGFSHKPGAGNKGPKEPPTQETKMDTAKEKAKAESPPKLKSSGRLLFVPARKLCTLQGYCMNAFICCLVMSTG